ncbi:MAG TPA: Rieske 2Fe-2S domain-containing protein [Alphaproteobacteria bacterium]
MKQEDNELLTRIGPGTRMGALLRRYWWPVGFTEKLADKPVPVRVLGEDLVMFRDGAGKVGLLERACPHRGTSLEHGRVEDKGLRCCYHGWLFNAGGQCLEMPAEPENSPFTQEMKTRAYKTQEAAGVIFAYLGPDPVPLLPAYDLLVREDMDRVVRAGMDNCNWLQRAENGADPCHSMALHASVYPSIALKRPSVVYEKTWYGLRFETQYEGGEFLNVYHHIVPAHTRRLGARAGYSHPAQFLHFRVPVDDYHTLTYIIEAVQTEDGKPGTLTTKGTRGLKPGEYQKIEDGWWGLASQDQDRIAQESQGVIADRTKESLASSDQGIAMFRRMLLDGLDAIDKGGDPMGVIRDRGQNHMIEFDAQKNFTDIVG